MFSAQPFTKLTHQIEVIDTTGGESFLRPQWGMWSTILDSKGVVVFESQDLLLTEVHISLQNLPGGIYLVEILLEEGIINFNRAYVKM